MVFPVKFPVSLSPWSHSNVELSCERLSGDGVVEKSLGASEVTGDSSIFSWEGGGIGIFKPMPWPIGCQGAIPCRWMCWCSLRMGMKFSFPSWAGDRSWCFFIKASCSSSERSSSPECLLNTQHSPYTFWLFTCILAQVFLSASTRRWLRRARSPNNFTYIVPKGLAIKLIKLATLLGLSAFT